MPVLYDYSAKDKAGATRKGEIAAKDHNDAVAMLIERGLTPVSLNETKKKPSGGENGFLSLLTPGRRAKSEEKVIFSRQLAVMIGAGVPVSKSLNILVAQSESVRIKDMAADLAKKVEGGQSLAKAMSNHPEVISPVYVSMVRAGETGGILNEVLERLADQEEKDADIRSKIRSAMMYPAVIGITAVASFFFLMVAIVPKLSDVFKDLGASLPSYTKAMLDVSDFMVSYWIIILAVLAGLAVAFKFWHATPPGKKVTDRLILKAPVFGKIIIKSNVARFARTLGSLTFAGTPLLEALRITKSAVSNTVYQKEIDGIIEGVKNGKSMSVSFKDSQHFPVMISQMMAVGEETGELDSILAKLAVYYEREVDNVISGLTAIIEPIFVILLGSLIGFIALSVFGSISALSSNL